MTPNRLLASLKFMNMKSEQHFADLLKMHQTTISRYINGLQSMPEQVDQHIKTLEKLYHVNNLIKKLDAMFEAFNASETNVEAEERMGQIKTAIKTIQSYTSATFPPKIYKPRGRPFAKKPEKITNPI